LNAPRTKQEFVEGSNKIVSIQLPLKAFLENENERMRALIQLYLDRCDDGLPPLENSIKPEDLFAVGMINHTHCLKIDPRPDNCQFTVWAPGANFDGHRSMQNACLGDLKPYTAMANALKRQLAGTVVHGRPTFYIVKGILNFRYYFFSKAILPLRSEQGEIVKCLVPFSDKLAHIPSNLRQKLCTGDLDQEE